MRLVEFQQLRGGYRIFKGGINKACIITTITGNAGGMFLASNKGYEVAQIKQRKFVCLHPV